MNGNAKCRADIADKAKSIERIADKIDILRAAVRERRSGGGSLPMLTGEASIDFASRYLSSRGISVSGLARQKFPTADELRRTEDSFYKAYRKQLKAEYKDAKGCDGIDYSVASFSGVVAGVIDALWVGMPGESALGIGVDKLSDKLVVALSNLMARPKHKNGRRSAPTNNIQLAIARLQAVFKINYDQTNSKQVKGLVKLCPNSHHLLSLAHAPDWIGLIVAVVNQFTSTSTFLSNGKLVTIDTKTFELYGKNVPAKLFCAIVNWFGHIVSDFNGSSTSVRTRGGHIGAGVCPPFFELTQLCGFGSIGEAKKTIAEVAEQVFEWGYDFRHFMTCAIPVIVNELTVRFFWALRQRMQYKKSLKECIPSARQPAVLRMLLVSYACFCTVDAADAGLRGGSAIVTFFLRCNIVAWYRLAQTSIGEFNRFVGKERVMMEIHTENIAKGTTRLRERFGLTLKDVEESLQRNGLGGFEG